MTLFQKYEFFVKKSDIIYDLVLCVTRRGGIEFASESRSLS